MDEGGKSNRFDGCYFDNNGVLLIDPLGVTLVNNFFLGAVNVEVPSYSIPLSLLSYFHSQTETITIISLPNQVRSSGQPSAVVSGLIISENLFVSGPSDPRGVKGVVVNETAGPFRAVNETFIQHNAYPPTSYGYVFCNFNVEIV